MVATHQLGVELGKPRLALVIENQECADHGRGTRLIIAQRPVSVWRDVDGREWPGGADTGDGVLRAPSDVAKSA